MNTRKTILSVLAAVLGIAGSVPAVANDHDNYVDSVMDVMRTHIALMRDLAGRHHFKYSDNIVRHALGIEHAFGLLGPMEWHAAESAKIRSELQGTHMDLDEEHFDELVKASRNSVRDLIRAAHDTLREYDEEGVNAALDNVQQACNNCHVLLPRAVAPDLWGPLERDLSRD